MRNNPYIQTGHDMQDHKEFTEGNQVGKDKKPTNSTTEVLVDKVGLLIWDLCKKGTNSIHSMSFMNTNKSYYIQRDPEKVIQGAERGG